MVVLFGMGIKIDKVMDIFMYEIKRPIKDLLVLIDFLMKFIMVN
jgi:hypothetical protein